MALHKPAAPLTSGLKLESSKRSGWAQHRGGVDLNATAIKVIALEVD